MAPEEQEGRVSAPAFAGLGRFDGALGLFTLALVVSMAVLFPLFELRVVWTGFVTLSASVAALSALLAFYGWRREARLSAVLRAAIWTLVLSNLCILPLYLPMRHAAPLADPFLARLDHGLGFDVGAIVAWVGARPSLARASAVVYDTLTLLCLFSVMVTSFMGRVVRAEVLLLAIVVGVFVTLVTAYILPAIGPWEAGDFAPTSAQASCGRVIRILRTSDIYAVDLANPDPIIATPSWHVILAVLAALALRPLKVIGPLSLLWGGLIVASTLTTGWHYLVDVLLGIVVAGLSHELTRRALHPWVVAPRGSSKL